MLVLHSYVIKYFAHQYIDVLSKSNVHMNNLSIVTVYRSFVSTDCVWGGGEIRKRTYLIITLIDMWLCVYYDFNYFVKHRLACLLWTLNIVQLIFVPKFHYTEFNFIGTHHFNLIDMTSQTSVVSVI